MAFGPIHIKPLLRGEGSVYPIEDTNTKIIIENEANCNFACADCNLGVRRNEKPIRRIDYSGLSERLAKHLPQGALLYFRGLGEPLLHHGQEVIEYVLDQRKDLRGHIQTNGSVPVNEKLEKIIREGRLNVSVSVDESHLRGARRRGAGRYELKIQKELVSGISVSLELKESAKLEIIASFPNLQIIDVGPMFSYDLRYLKSDAETVLRGCTELAEALIKTFVYTEARIKPPNVFLDGKIQSPEEESSRFFYEYSGSIQGNGLSKTDNENWVQIIGNRFFIYAGPELLADRIMLDGKVIPKEIRFIALESSDKLSTFGLPSIEERYLYFHLQNNADEQEVLHSERGK